jgi:hypothetical protein
MKWSWSKRGRQVREERGARSVSRKRKTIEGEGWEALDPTTSRKTKTTVGGGGTRSDGSLASFTLGRGETTQG